MMIWLTAAISTRLGQQVAVGLGAVALFFVWLWHHDTKVANKATTELVRNLNTAAEKNADEAAKARDPAMRPGAAARLRNSACRDC